MRKSIKTFFMAAGVACLVMASPIVTMAAEAFDPAYYAAAYPDVAAALGTDGTVLLKHYLATGMAEGRVPYEGAQPGAEISNAADAFTPVPMDQLANKKSLQKRATDAQLAEAYNIAVELVKPYVGLSKEEQVVCVTQAIRNYFDSGMQYSMSTDHYNDPYGFFVLGSASCAGCTRATGLCLNILGIPYEHVNENQYSHQWARFKMGDEYWISDAYGLYCGPEPAPYVHPYMN